MTNTLDGIIIVGGGQAGAQAAISLRQGGHKGAISIISEESVPPYQRPPLSKAFMKGDVPKERLFLRPAVWYEDQNVSLVLSSRVVSLDRTRKEIALEGGEVRKFEHLILATGSRPRPFPVPGADLDRVFQLRSIADVEAIQPHMRGGQKIAIIGAGYIGLEAAAVARQMGLEVTVLEMAPRVLERVTSETISAFFEREHRARGVNIKTDAQVVALEGDGNTISKVVLNNDESIPVDLVLIGIGILPNQELAAAAGIDCENGIVTDQNARTSDPTIFAIGDCARRPLELYGTDGRLESVHNAIEQGKQAAAAILDRPRPPLDCPWFWSDQYDLKLQIAGLSAGYDRFVVRGDPETRKFSVFYFKEKNLIAVDAINSAPDFMMSKKIILANKPVDADVFEDPSSSIKEIAMSVLN